MPTLPPAHRGSYDFSSPFMAAAILAADGNRYPLVPGPDYAGGFQGDVLSSGLGTPGEDAQQPRFLPYLSSLSVTLQLGYIPQITATLTPPYEEARKLIDWEIITYGSGAKLEATFGYSSGRGASGMAAVSPTFTGLLDKPDVSLGADITVSLTARGEAGYTLAATDLTATTSATMSVAAFMRRLCEKLGLELDDRLVGPGTTPRKLLDATQSFSYVNRSYHSVIYEQARRCGCYIAFTDRTVKLLPISWVIKSEPVADLVLFDIKDGRIGPDVSRYPILTASTEHGGIFLSGIAKKRFAAGPDPRTGETRMAEAGPQTTPVATTRNGAVGVGDKSTDVSRRAVTIPVKDDDDAKLKADYQAVFSASSMGIKLEVETLGAPDLLPGQIVNVCGVSRRIDGKYAIMEVKHELSSGGYSTSLTLNQSATAIWTAQDKVFKSLDPNMNATASATSSDRAAQELTGDSPLAVKAKPQ